METSPIVEYAVIPAAGKGTRMFPLTKSTPKELAPVAGLQAIVHVVREAFQAGLRKIVIVTSEEKKASFEQLFSIDSGGRSHGADDEWIQRFSKSSANQKQYALARELVMLGTHIEFAIQERQRGLGDAVLAAHSVVGNNPCAVLLPDDLMLPGSRDLQRMISFFRRHPHHIVATQRVGLEAIGAYGSLVPAAGTGGPLLKITEMVEKPEHPTSDYAVLGRYVLHEAIWPALQATSPGKNDEVQLTDALEAGLRTPGVFASEVKAGIRYDIGTPEGLEVASPAFRAAIQSLNLTPS